MSKRYKLKKDLPTFRAGQEFFLSSSGSLWSLDGHDRDGGSISKICAYGAVTLDKFPNILTDWFEEILEEPKTVWDLEGSMRCWVIGDDTVWEERWCDIVGAVDKRNAGRIALSEDEAKKELARCKARTILLRDTKGFKPDWSREEVRAKKYFVVFDVLGNDLCVDFTNSYRENKIYFPTEEDAEASIKTHKKEWLTYLGVEGE